MKLLAKMAEDCYQSARGLTADLEICLANLPGLEDLSDFIPGQDDVSERFQIPQNYVFQRFAKAMARKEQPLVIFLDDLQWIDAASLNLLKVLLTDHDLTHFLIIGAYRDNEVDATHSLLMGVAELQKANVNLERLTMQNLSETDLNTLTSDTLQCTPADSRPLSRLVYARTTGNAFFGAEDQPQPIFHQRDLILNEHAEKVHGPVGRVEWGPTYSKRKFWLG